MRKVLLVGAGRMAREYAKVLKARKLDFFVVGRSEKTAEEFKKETGTDVITGGLSPDILRKEKDVKTAIVATSVESLGENTRLLLQHGFTSILLEKPGGLNRKDIEATVALARDKNAEIFVAYNRRFYVSVARAKEYIAQDGGVLSFTFDFSERINIVEKLPIAPEVKKEWFLANSSHVADLVFFLAGKPKILNTLVSGSLPWHPKGAIFVGSGETETGAFFSYHADWLSGGRWSIEIMTPKRKLILRPLEKLFMQEKDSLDIKEVLIEDKIDLNFKAGVFREIESFLGDKSDLPTINDQVKNLSVWEAISGGKNID